MRVTDKNSQQRDIKEDVNKQIRIIEKLGEFQHIVNAVAYQLASGVLKTK